ncbi:hypothetical protein MMC24_004718 [Lignoscripta atroalba]|nr:hypothetical protein [Lignoscripta atroalba]
MLLKVTHLPYVAAIWAYESAHEHLHRGDHRWQPKTQSPKRPRFANHISTSRKAKFSALRSKSETSLVRADVRANPGGANDLSDMKQMIVKLSRQVDELTSRLG